MNILCHKINVFASKLGLTYDNDKTSFTVTCGKGGIFPTEPDWPTCSTHQCSSIPSNDNFKTSAQAPVSVGTKITYECISSGKKTYDS